MKDKITSIIEESVKVKEQVKEKLIDNIMAVTEEILTCYNKGNKLLICGNGGSAADAQHFVGELMGKFKMERTPLPCIALTTNSSLITAWSNDFSFDTVFERQIEALGDKDDVLISITTSGNSENIIKGIQKAKELGMRTASLLGKDGGKTRSMSDIEVIVPSDNTPRIQEAHILIIHIICELVEEQIFKGQ